MGWALINFSCLWGGRLLEMGANSRLSAYSNKYGIYTLLWCDIYYDIDLLEKFCAVSGSPNNGLSSSKGQVYIRVNIT